MSQPHEVNSVETPGKQANELEELVRALAKRTKRASGALADAPSAHKDAVLLRAEVSLSARSSEILRANHADVDSAKSAGLPKAMIDRLVLDEKRLEEVCASIRQITELPDPVGRLEGKRKLPSGIVASKMRVPLGVVGIVYEARPNVTVDAAALCIKSGNAVVLRGGKEAFHTNQVLSEIMGDALEQEGFSRDAVSLIPTTDRAATLALIQCDDFVDLVIPRGGEGLIRFVTQNARVPVIRHYKGVCHVYVDSTADLDKAVAIIRNAKVQRPSACNAVETLLVDRLIAPMLLPKVASALETEGVTLHIGQGVETYLPGRQADPDFDREYLSLDLNVALVDGFEDALAHIRRHGSLHTECLVSEDKELCDMWLRRVDASVVLTNASTRFNDGGQLGLGAEMGISTSKLHVYGPMGLEELCTQKWVVRGSGQVRK